MAGERDDQTALGQRAAPSPHHRLCSAAASRDWHRRHQRLACIRLHRQHLEVQMEPTLKRTAASSPLMISRAQRAHSRLSWDERLARNGRAAPDERITLTLFGIPDRLATFLGMATASCPSSLQRSILSSNKDACPSGFFCLLFLIDPHIHALFLVFPFIPSFLFSLTYFISLLS